MPEIPPQQDRHAAVAVDHLVIPDPLSATTQTGSPATPGETSQQPAVTTRVKSDRDSAVRAAEPLDPIRLDELHSAEDGFRQRYPLCWLLTLYGPPCLTILAIVGVWIYAGGEFTRRLLVSTALSLYVLGRFVILSGSEGQIHQFEGGLSSEHLFLLLMWMDVVTAMVLAFHIGFLFRLPLIGGRIAALVTDGHFILDAHPWMRRATFVGLTAFVAFPLTATGSVGGSIFGRLLGMTRLSTFLGILLGSFLGNGVMYVFSESLARWIDKDHPVIKYGGFLLIAMLAVLLEHRYRRLRSQFEARDKADSAHVTSGIQR